MGFANLMQTPIAFQFQAALLGVVRAWPAADAPLRQGIQQTLADWGGETSMLSIPAPDNLSLSPSSDDLADKPAGPSSSEGPSMTYYFPVLLLLGTGAAAPPQAAQPDSDAASDLAQALAL